MRSRPAANGLLARWLEHRSRARLVTRPREVPDECTRNPSSPEAGQGRIPPAPGAERRADRGRCRRLGSQRRCDRRSCSPRRRALRADRVRLRPPRTCGCLRRAVLPAAADDGDGPRPAGARQGARGRRHRRSPGRERDSRGLAQAADLRVRARSERAPHRRRLPPPEAGQERFDRRETQRRPAGHRRLLHTAPATSAA